MYRLIIFSALGLKVILRRNSGPPNVLFFNSLTSFKAEDEALYCSQFQRWSKTPVITPGTESVCACGVRGTCDGPAMQL